MITTVSPNRHMNLKYSQMHTDTYTHTLACSILVTTRTVPSTTPGQHGVPFKTLGSEDASACC